MTVAKRAMSGRVMRSTTSYAATACSRVGAAAMKARRMTGMQRGRARPGAIHFSEARRVADRRNELRRALRTLAGLACAAASFHIRMDLRDRKSVVKGKGVG